MKIALPVLILCVFLFLLAAFAAYFLLAVFKKTSPVSPAVENDSLNNQSHFSNPSPAPTSNPQVFNLLLLGQGDPGHAGSQLTDSLILVHLDTLKKTLSLISVPRDTWLTLAPNQEQKINAAFSLGGLPLVKQAVTTVTNLPVNAAILIDFNGFVQAIDDLGGVSVNVPHTFDDYFYPVKGKEMETCGKSPEDIASLSATQSGFLLEKQFPCRYEHLHFDQGKASIDGATALKFVRSRHSDQFGNDFARSERQQALLLGVKDKLLSLKALDDLPAFFDQVSHLFKTDLNRQTVQAVASLVTNFQNYTLSQIVLSDQNVFVSSTGPGGQYILLPKANPDQWSAVHQFIQQQLEVNHSPPQN